MVNEGQYLGPGDQEIGVLGSTVRDTLFFVGIRDFLDNHALGCIWHYLTFLGP